MRWRQLFKKETIPGWVLVLWDRIDHISRVQFVWQSGDWLVMKLSLAWGYVRGSAWLLGIAWLTAVVLWPDIKKKLWFGAAPYKEIDDAASLRSQVAGLRATNDSQAKTIDSYKDKLDKAEARARWAENQAPAKSTPEDDLAGMDDKVYQNFRNEFPQRWQDRLALKWLWAQPSLEISMLKLMFQNNGFADSEVEMLGPLLANTMFVEANGSKAWIKSTEARKALNHLFKEHPLC